jgi:hypothetical protein
MGTEAIGTSVTGEPAHIQSGLAAYPGELDEVVVRAIAADETLPAYQALLRAASPGVSTEQ